MAKNSKIERTEVLWINPAAEMRLPMSAAMQGDLLEQVR